MSSISDTPPVVGTGNGGESQDTLALPSEVLSGAEIGLARRELYEQQVAGAARRVLDEALPDIFQRTASAMLPTIVSEVRASMGVGAPIAVQLGVVPSGPAAGEGAAADIAGDGGDASDAASEAAGSDSFTVSLPGNDPTAGVTVQLGAADLQKLLLRDKPGSSNDRLPRITPPAKFDGTASHLENFLMCSEEYFRQHPGMPESAKAWMMGDFLVPHSTAHLLHMDLMRDLPLEQRTLQSVVDLLRMHFGNRMEECDALRLWHNSEQGEMTVAQWHHRVLSLISRRGMDSVRRDTDMVIRCFVIKLRPDLRAKMLPEIKTFATLEEAVDAATVFESSMQLVRRSFKPGSNNFTHGAGRAWRPRGAKMAALQDGFGGDSKDWISEEDYATQLAAMQGAGGSHGRGRGGPGRGSGGGRFGDRFGGRGGGRGFGRGSGDDLPVPGKDGKTLPAMRCFNCKFLGHVARQCPHPPALQGNA